MSVFQSAYPVILTTVYLRLENGRDDMRVRAEILEREVAELQLRNEELTSLAQEAQALKDEMDILRWEQLEQIEFSSSWKCKQASYTVVIM